MQRETVTGWQDHISAGRQYLQTANETAAFRNLMFLSGSVSASGLENADA
ncbi:MAG: hypothetical protein QNI89_10375 [Desulfobacterales bacterium]|nr:hypothetical protein [Desulfobacterales bacterium]MDJ0887700.1 hypothetical protein [Desulfobacterales bacterium]